MLFSELFTHCPACGSSGFVTNNEKSNRCTNCNFVYYINPSAAVAAFILNKNGDLLVSVRGKEPEKGKWDLPGGFVDANETAETAISRELKEELNAHVLSSEYLFSLPNTYLYSGLSIPTLDLFYLCTLANVENLIAADDVASFQFVSLKNIDPNLFGFTSVKKAVALFLQMRH